MSKLAALRAKLLEKDNKQASATYDNALFPFWNIKDDETAVIRFLPDGNTKNDYFWVESQKIRLKFSGIKGQDMNKEVVVQVPCNEMFGGTCPVLTEIRPWFKEPSMEDLARSYWKKRSYIFQGFVRQNPLMEQDPPENPIRRFFINPSIFDIIKASLLDEEMEDMPTDYVAGTDFRLTKTKQGEYASYKTSSYSRKSTSLTEDELAAIEQYGLNDLSDFLPKQPNDRELQAIQEMFEASVDGQLYDPDRWGEFYRPSGLEWSGRSSNSDSENSATTNRVSKPAESAPQESASKEETAPWEDEKAEPVAEKNETVAETRTEEKVEAAPAPTSEKKTPEQILAEIKARAQK